MNLKQINIIPSQPFTNLLTSDELLQINSNVLTIIDVHTGFVKYKNFLQSAPTGCYFNQELTTKIALTFKNKVTQIESLTVIDPYTGEKFREIVLHQKDGFNLVSVGTNVFFTLKSNPNIVYFMPFSEGQIAQLDYQSPVTAVVGHPTENKFLVSVAVKLLCVSCKDGSKEWESHLSGFAFIKYVGSHIAIGFLNGEIHIMNENGIAIVKNIQTPHNTACLLYTSPSPRDLSTSRMPSSA